MAVRVTIPEAPDLVTLIYPTIGPVLDLAPIPWEVCGDPYTTPFDVVVLTRPDGQVSAMATRDLPDSQLLMMWPWIVGIGIALISAAPVWALWAGTYSDGQNHSDALASVGRHRFRDTVHQRLCQHLATRVAVSVLDSFLSHARYRDT